MERNLQMTRGSAARRWNQLSRLLIRLGPYAVVALVAACAAALVLRPWSVSADALMTGGGDAPWLQASVQSVGQVGPFGTNPHLGWPAGFSPWSLPQLGLGLLAGAWLLAGVLSVGSASSALWLLCFVIAGDAVMALFLFRSWLRERLGLLAGIAAVALSLSPYSFTPIAHMNVAAFLLLPFALAIVVRGRERGPRWWGVAGACLAVGGALSPMWWSFVALVLLTLMAVGRLMQRNWLALLQVITVVAAMGVGIGAELLLYRAAAIPGEAATRNAWDSNVYGGHLLDFLDSSPFLNSMISSLRELTPGISVEFKPLGLIPAAGAIFCLLMLLKGTAPWVVVSKSRTVRTGTLALGSIAAVLLFVGGGFGGVQAGLAVLAGGQSPARVWSRLSILIALLGLAWALLYGAKLQSRIRSSKPARAVAYSLIAVAVLATVLADLRPTIMAAPRIARGVDDLPERQAVDFLENRLTACPIAQLPLETAPSVRLPYGQRDIEPLMYRGYVPYILAPSFYWSYGQYVPESEDVLYQVGVKLTAADEGRMARSGYCAILFDKSIADFATAHGVELQGRAVGAIGKPSFESERYDVYLLTSPSTASGRGAPK